MTDKASNQGTNEQPATTEQQIDALKRRGVSAFVIVPNLIVLIAIVLYFMISRGGEDKVYPLVQADPKTRNKISRLEAALAKAPQDGEIAVKLARAYMRAGEAPFSYQALRSAEEKAGEAPDWRMSLGMAYVEIGKSKDGYRVLKEAHAFCVKAPKKCGPALRARLATFLRIVERLIAKGVEVPKQPKLANKIFEDVVKKVDISEFDGAKPGAEAPSKTAKTPQPPKAE